MNATALLAEVEGLGVRLMTTADGKLVALPRGRLTAALRAQLSAHRRAVMALLARKEASADAAVAGPCGECGSTAWTVSLVDDDGNRTCHDCVTGTTAMRRAGVPI
jgi:hypothetical protein